MSFNRYKKKKNNFNNFIKRLLLGKGLRERKILFGRAKGICMHLDSAYNLQRLTGAYEHEILATFVSWSKKCGCFFDIGAFDGYYSLIYKKYNPAGDVYLFEADKNLEEIQRKNLALNNIASGFHLYFRTVSGIVEDWQILPGGLPLMHNRVLIKIDVEGAEATVLAGMRDLLKENDCRLIIETHSALLEKDCMALLNNQGYATRIIKNTWWRSILPERRPLEHNRWLAAWRDDNG
jgi:hypothetical protein